MAMEMGSATHTVSNPCSSDRDKIKGKGNLKGSITRLLHKVVQSATTMFMFCDGPLARTCIT